MLAFNAAINARDLTALDRLMTDDHALIDTAGGTIEGREHVLGCVPRVLRRVCGLAQHLVGGPADRWRGNRDRWSVCPDEPLLDGPAIWAAEARGGRVSEWRIYADTTANRRRLGIRP